MSTITEASRSLFLADYEVQALRASGRIAILRIIAEPPLAQPRRQLLADCPFGPIGRTFYVREDFQQLGAHLIYRADFDRATMARMAPWCDAAQMRHWQARLGVEVCGADIDRGGPTGWRWAVLLRRVEVRDA